MRADSPLILVTPPDCAPLGEPRWCCPTGNYALGWCSECLHCLRVNDQWLHR